MTISCMENCIFCKIVSKDIPASIVYEDEHSIAFLDISPQMKGHTLLVPKYHARNILDLPDVEAQAHGMALKKVGHAIKKALHADGLNIEMNLEPAGGQLVFHAHTHIMPRYVGDDVVLIHNKSNASVSKEDSAKALEAIRKAF